MWQNNHRENNGVIERLCTSCKEWKAETIEYFYMYNKKNLKRGFMAECKMCSIKRSDTYQRKNPDKMKRYMKKEDQKPSNKARRRKWTQEAIENGYYKKYFKNNPDKAKQYQEKHRDHDISKKEWLSCCSIFDWKCAYCDKTIEQQFNENQEQFHKDHVDHNGANDLSNCVCGCTQCNTTKRQMNIDELFESGIISQFTIEKLGRIKWWVIEGYKDYIEDKPPYKVIKKQNENDKKCHWELWSVNKKRNMVECLSKRPQKKDLKVDIIKFFE